MIGRWVGNAQPNSSLAAKETPSHLDHSLTAMRARTWESAPRLVITLPGRHT